MENTILQSDVLARQVQTRNELLTELYPLIAQYAQRLYRACQADRDDVAHNAVLCAIQSLHRCGKDYTPRIFARFMVKRAIFAQTRRRDWKEPAARPVIISQIVDEANPDDIDPVDHRGQDGEPAGAAAADIVSAAMQRLTDQERQWVTRLYLNGETTGQIAATLNLHRSTVGHHCLRAKKKFEAALAELHPALIEA